MRRAALAVLGGLLAVAVVVLAFPPGRYDLAAGDATGTMAHDEGYWSAPISPWHGAATYDAYDRLRALSLALPQNLAGAAATAVGLPFAWARSAGSLCAAFALGALLVLARGAGRLAVLALLLAPPVLGHLRGDLAEGTAIGLVAAWAFAASRGRVATCAALAAVALHQKGAGLYLGAGTLALVFAAPAGARWRALGRGAVAGTAAYVVAIGAAALVFSTAPIPLVVGPWRATGDFWRAPSLASIAVQAAFPGHEGFGPYVALPFLGAALLAPTRRVGAAWVVAACAGLLYRGYFATTWRLVPVLPLLLLTPLAPPAGSPAPLPPPPGPLPAARGPRRGGARRVATTGRLLGVLALPQAVGAFVAWAAWDAGARGLAVVSIVAIAAHHVALRRAPAAVRAVGLAALALGCVVGPARLLAHDEVRSVASHALAERVAREVGAGETLVAQPVVGLAHRGPFYLQNLEPQWTDLLLAARPARVWRVGKDRPDAPPSASAFRDAYVLRETRPLGTWPYSPYGRPEPLVLLVYEPAP